MRIAIAGGNGFIGRALTTELTKAGHDVVWLSHRTGRAADRPPEDGPIREVAFDGRSLSSAAISELCHADAVANLSGFPISARWNDRTKSLIRSTRIDLTTVLLRGMVACRAKARDEGVEPKPAVLVNASAVGIYGNRGDRVMTEDESAGKDWLARLASDWESSALSGREDGIRVVTVRTGIVLGEEGALKRFLLPMKLFIGGPIGSGKQWFPWVHVDDVVGIYKYALENPDISGPVNAVAPDERTMGDFARTLGSVLNRPSWMPVPLFALRIVVGEMAEYLLMSQRVSAGKAVASGYEFRFSELEPALRDVLG